MLLVVFSSSAFSNATVELVYSDLRFDIPGDFSLVANIGDSQNVLIFRYGDELGKRYLAFSDMSNDKTIDYGCPVAVFFEGVFSGPVNPGCNQQDLKVMQDVFVRDRRVERWDVGRYSVIYSDLNRKSYLFVIGGEEKLLRIGSDFLSYDALKRIVEGI